MSDTDIKDMEKALDAILSMADKGKKAQVKFRRGTSQYTLLENRINALNIAFSLINIYDPLFTARRAFCLQTCRICRLKRPKSRRSRTDARGIKIL